jgi:hypothetical protein
MKYSDVPGRADYCVYGFRRAHDEFPTGGRAGLIGTNMIRQNFSAMGKSWPSKFQMMLRARTRPLVRCETGFATLMSVYVPKPLSEVRPGLCGPAISHEMASIKSGNLAAFTRKA